MTSVPSSRRELIRKCVSDENRVTVVLGAQWGDEGKGELVDLLATDADVVCRCQAGNNADHNVVVNGTEYNFHLLPTGILHPNCTSVIGNGVVVHLPGLFDEIAKNEAKGIKNWQQRLLMSERAHLVFDFHQFVDSLQEEEKGKLPIGTTKMGIGPTYSCKASRVGIHVGDLLGDFKVFRQKLESIVTSFTKQFPHLKVDIEAELTKYRDYAEKVRPLVTDTIVFLNGALKSNCKIVVEGANAALLDIDFGTYPYVTSSNCSIGGVCTGLGIPPKNIGDVFGVVKAYTSRAGCGPFPTEQKNEIGNMLQRRGAEIGITAGRIRRCGWLDLPLLNYSSMVNGYTAIALMKLDILDELEEIKIGVAYYLHGKKINTFPANENDLYAVEVEYVTMPGWQTSIQNVRSYEELPLHARNYVEKIEEILELPVKWIGVGRDRDAIIKLF